MSSRENSARSPGLLPWLLLLFVGSGCAALIYEIVWFQLLELVIGSTAISMGVLLGTFMGGMCLGSLMLPRWVRRGRHPLRVYACLELGTGIFGLLLLWGMPYVSHVYVAHVGHGMPGLLLRGLVCAACLLPPTILMGATLPAISRWVRTTPQGIAWMGFFYGGNIAGAILGCLLAGFYLLRVWDTVVATYVAVAVNAIVAILGLFLAHIWTHWQLEDDLSDSNAIEDGWDREGEARAEPHLSNEPGSAGASPSRRTFTTPQLPDRARAVYLIIALSGFTALGAEVVWTRLLSLMLGGTVYSFSIILAVFLIGLAVGSSFGAAMAKSPSGARLRLAGAQFLLIPTIAWAAYMSTRSLPYWPIDYSIAQSPWFVFQLDLLRCMWALLPATVLWGASFPLALGAVARRGQDPGRLVGGVYAANTLGAILGGVLFSIVLVPALGSQGSQRVMIAMAVVSALLAFAPSLRSRARHRIRLAAAVAVVAALSVSGGLALRVPPISAGLVAWGRYLPTTGDPTHVAFLGEGMNSTVAVTGQDPGIRYFHVAGKVEASTDPADMRLQRMLGHLPALVHRNPKKVLVVGCGAGITAGSFVVYPGLERVVICDIEPLIPKVVSTHFRNENNNVINDPRTQVVFDDARHYVLSTDEQFDIITSDPIHPWVKGAATLYTKEYFEMVRRHLSPGGVVTQWVPLYESSLEAVQSEIATFFDVFPEGTVWANNVEGRGYDVVLMGQAGPTSIDVDALAERVNRPDYELVKKSLRQVGFSSVVSLLSTYAGRGSDLKPWLAHAQLNRDRNLRLQYLAGMGASHYFEGLIYDDMIRYRTYPDDVFIASDMTRMILRQAIDPRWK
ncbi:MAG TPA: fused MFS/spermidine synthase [Tepidisphaeraceae bacterium]|nr:fused MFS/spermidine synthase [Tepidisphaeraceae bacterium]